MEPNRKEKKVSRDKSPSNLKAQVTKKNGNVENKEKEDKLIDQQNKENNELFLEECSKRAQERIKSNKNTFKKVLKINTSKCRSEAKLVKLIIKNYDWKEVRDVDSCDILWNGSQLKPEDYEILLVTKINRIPGMDDLAHKKTTGWFLNKFQEYFPDKYDFYPKTFLLPEQYTDFINYFENNRKNKYLYIAKPTMGSHGDGIELISKPEDLKKMSKLKEGQFVVQRYIDNPLLINKKKFDLRLYVFISSVKPLIVFLNDHGLTRYCTEDYEKPTEKNLNNHYMHLTNYTLNKNSKNFILTKECEEMTEGSKTTIVSFWKSVAEAGYKREQIMDQIEILIKNFITSMYPFMINDLNMFYGNKEAKSFQILGFDIMIDENLKPWLLEINSNPSLNICHDPTSENIKNPEISPVDFYVKEKIVEDCLLLMSSPLKFHIDIGVDNYFNTYKCLMSGSVEEMEEMVIFNKLLQVYGKLSGFKFRGYITGVRFNKLHPLITKLTNKIQKYDYDLLFQKVKGLGGNMDFYGFIKMIEIMAEKIYDDYKADNKLVYVSKLVEYLSENFVV